MAKIKMDLTNKQFGYLTVTKQIGSDPRKGAIWEVVCVCGTIFNRPAYYFNNPKCANDCGCKRKCASNKLHLENQRYGHLVVVSEVLHNNKNRITKWLCKCDCGNEIIVNSPYLRNGVKTHCGCLKLSHTRKRGNCGNITLSFYNSVKKGAKVRNKEFNISIEYMDEVFKLQQGKCALTGKDICINSPSLKQTTASLDRIDSSKGYIIGNIQFVLKHINTMKMDLSQDDFISLCKDVAIKFS